MADDLLWNGVKRVTQGGVALGCVAFIGDDLGSTLKDIGGDDKDSIWRAICTAVGSFFDGASSISAGLLSGVTNFFDPFIPVDHEDAENARKALSDAIASKDATAIDAAKQALSNIEYRYTVADDFKNVTAPENAGTASEAIAGGKYDANNVLTKNENIVPAKENYNQNGFLTTIGNAFTSIKDSAAVEFAVNNPMQAAGATILAGAGAEVLGRIGKEAVAHQVNVNVHPSRA